MAQPEIDVDSLSVEERLRLIDRLWESLSSKRDQLPLTRAQEAELDRRQQLDQSDGEPWREVLCRIREGL